MLKWLIVAGPVLQTHFAASYLVPLDDCSQREFGGALRWFWPWAYGDGGLLGPITPMTGFPITGFYVAMAAAALLAVAALAVSGLWVPSAWSRTLAVGGGAALFALLVLFFSPTKLIPMAFALATLYVAVTYPTVVVTE